MMPRRLAIVLLMALCLSWCAQVFIQQPSGYNLSIYRFNAALSLDGKSAYVRSVPPDCFYGSCEQHPRYLDYSGAQHALYVFAEKISRLLGGAAGYMAYQAVLGALTLILVVVLGHWRALSLIAAAVILFNPIVTNLLLFPSWEDKLFFVIFPLAVVVLSEKNLFRTAAMVAGVGSVFNGSTALLLVPLLILRRNQWGEMLGFAVVGICIGLIPFVPDSAYGWLNRASRMSIEKPFWFSPYILLPEGFYSPIVNLWVTIVSTIVFYFSFFRNLISFRAMVVFCVFIVSALGPFTAPSKLLPVVLLVLALGEFNLFGLSIVALSMFAWKFVTGVSNMDIQSVQVIYCFLPVLVAVLAWNAPVLASKRCLILRNSSP